jgi:hypothetical protein
LKMQSAGWRGNLPSIVNLFLVVHKDQHCAAKNVHSSLRGLGDKEFRMLIQSCLDLGFQSTLNIIRTPLHRNSARWHWKKIWSTFSGSPQRTQLPSEAPPQSWILHSER